MVRERAHPNIFSPNFCAHQSSLVSLSRHELFDLVIVEISEVVHLDALGLESLCVLRLRTQHTSHINGLPGNLSLPAARTIPMACNHDSTLSAVFGKALFMP